MDLRSTINSVSGSRLNSSLALTWQLVARAKTISIHGRAAQRLGEAGRLTRAQAVAGKVTRADDQDQSLPGNQDQQGRPNLLVNNPDKFLPYDFKSNPDTLQKTESEIAINATAPLTPKKVPADPVRDISRGLRGARTAMGLGQSCQIGFLGRILPDFLFRRFAKNGLRFPQQQGHSHDIAVLS